MRKYLYKKIKWNFICILIISLITTSFTTAFSISSLTENKNSSNLIDNFYGTSSRIYLQDPNINNIAFELESNGFDILWDTITKDTVEIIVTPNELIYLENLGFDPIILSKGRPFKDIQAENSIGLKYVPPDYPDLSEIYNEMEDAAMNTPSICEMIDLTDKYNVNPTYEDRHLYAVKISDNVEIDEDEPAFLMVSCHHCREIVTPVIALYAIEQLTTNYGSDPQITSIVDNYEIWISPVWNPDGYEYVFNVDNMWRKNRRYFSDYSSYGVDLNRNYPFGWDGGCSGSTDPFSETYKGPSSASEAETQTMIAFSNDQHFSKVIDYHSYGREVLFGYHPSCHSHPFDSFLESEAVNIATNAGYGNSVRYASAEGENYQWQLVMNGSYANLMETHTNFQPSYSSAQAEAAQVWPSTLWILERSISMSGNVIASFSGQPIIADINICGITFPNGEEFKSEGSFGRYHLFLPPGDYTIEFSAEGYITHSEDITVTLDSAEVIDILLNPINDYPFVPLIDGRTSGEVGSIYMYTFLATDPDNDELYYYIDWGDGNIEEWIGPYDSGEQVIVNHGWSEGGTYTIKAKVKDVYNAESDWGYLDIEMPVSHNLQNLNLLRRIIEQLPLLERLITLKI